MVTYLIEPGQSEVVDAIDAAHEGPGYPCFGGPSPTGDTPYDGEDLLARLLGQWAPGMGAVRYPDGTGVRIEPGSRAIFQVHYNAQSLKDVGTDRSIVRFQTAKSVERDGLVIPWLNAMWPADPGNMLIPAKEADVSHGWSGTMSDSFTAALYGSADINDSFLVHSFFPHMHKLGRSLTLTQIKPDGTEIIMLRIPRYDFNWQREYILKTPIEVQADDQIRIECTWDNTKEQRARYGLTGALADVVWGEGTQDEMCVSTLYITVP